MSSRQLRKLQQQRELEQAEAKLQAEVEAEDDESEDEPVALTKSRASLFTNLAAFEDEPDEEDEDEDEKEPAEEDLSEPEPTPTPAPKAKKSKKKKKAKKPKRVEEEKTSNSADEIDAVLRELDIKQRANPSSTPLPKLDPQYEKVCKLLGISSQHLKVGNEMKNLFGRAALDNHDDAGGPVGRGARRTQPNEQMDLETALKKRAPDKGLPEISLRRNNFIQGKDDWPNGTTGGLTMAIDEGIRTDGTLEFKYQHDQGYQRMQQSFKGYVEIGDPQNLIGLLMKEPYHLSLLIQVSKIAKNQGDHALSADLIERALFTLSRAASSTFNTKLGQGKARLGFLRPENRELFLAGSHYIKVLMMKGTYRTALEWAKLLLSIDPVRDSYCMRLVIHHLALRAHEFQWLTDLYDAKWKGDGKEAQSSALHHITPSLAYAAMLLRQPTKCRELLADSMNKVPWLFYRLFRELDLDAPPSIWGIEPRTDSETLFTEIYVLQTKDLWGTPEALALLMEIAHTIPKVDISKIPHVENSEMTLDVVRFVYLDNTPALMALAPSSLLHKSNNSESDPLPPDNSIVSYESQRNGLSDGPEGIGGNFNHPVDAVQRLIGGMFGRRAEAHLIAQFRGQAADPDNHNDDDDDDVGDNLPELDPDQVRGIRDMLDSAGIESEAQAPGLLRRLINFIAGPRGMDDWADEIDEEDEAQGTDTDEDMPALVDEDGGVVERHESESESGSDNEIPPLI